MGADGDDRSLARPQLFRGDPQAKRSAGDRVRRFGDAVDEIGAPDEFRDEAGARAVEELFGGADLRDAPCWSTATRSEITMASAWSW